MVVAAGTVTANTTETTINTPGVSGSNIYSCVGYAWYSTGTVNRCMWDASPMSGAAFTVGTQDNASLILAVAAGTAGVGGVAVRTCAAGTIGKPCKGVIWFTGAQQATLPADTAVANAASLQITPGGSGNMVLDHLSNYGGNPTVGGGQTSRWDIINSPETKSDASTMVTAATTATMQWSSTIEPALAAIAISAQGGGAPAAGVVRTLPMMGVGRVMNYIAPLAALAGLPLGERTVVVWGAIPRGLVVYPKDMVLGGWTLYGTERTVAVPLYERQLASQEPETLPEDERSIYVSPSIFSEALWERAREEAA